MDTYNSKNSALCNASFTSGAWSLKNDLILDSEKNVIADVLHNTDIRPAEIRPNGKLIASAPELIKRLDDISRRLERANEPNDLGAESKAIAYKYNKKVIKEAQELILSIVS